MKDDDDVPAGKPHGLPSLDTLHNPKRSTPYLIFWLIIIAAVAFVFHWLFGLVGWEQNSLRYLNRGDRL